MGNYSVHDLRATRIEGTIFEFVTHEAGQRFAVRDMDGNVVIRDRGALTYTYLFDEQGDDAPVGTFVADIDFRISGPHPGHDVDFCTIVVSLIG